MDEMATPQSTQDLTVFVQNLLQQMQGRFATMSDAIIGRSACQRRAASLEPKGAGEAAKDAYFRSMGADPRLQAIVADFK